MSGTNWAAVESALRTRGLWDEDGVKVAAKARLCRRCSAPVLVALADGCPVAVEPAPLTALGEAQALMIGRPTFWLRWLSGHYEMGWRSALHISASPANSKSEIEVVTEHVCGEPLPAQSLGPELRTRVQKTITSDQPNF